MPAKNVVRRYVADYYYHVYNRGVAKQPVFLDESDKQYFLMLFDRHLNAKNEMTNSSGRLYEKFDQQLELLCYCLMGNHFHLLFYLGKNTTAISELMKAVGVAYTMYFNLKYERVGPLFQGKYKASRISSDSYLLHISRYIHMNPRQYATYEYSSLAVYMGEMPPMWLRPKRVLDLFEGGDYMNFLDDYQDRKRLFDEIKAELASQ